jgi:hypothetical protein
MGHASITETFNRYGRLFPATKEEAAAMLDAYLERKEQLDLLDPRTLAELHPGVVASSLKRRRSGRYRGLGTQRSAMTEPEYQT